MEATMHISTKSKHNLCWQLLFHMLGIGISKAPENSNNSESDSNISKLLDEVLGYEVFRANIGKKSVENCPEYVFEGHEENQNKRLFAIAGLVSDILTRDMRLGKSVPFELWRENEEQADSDDTEGVGISRNPFRNIPPGMHDDVALAAICYLMRGYAIFFYRSDRHRDLNTAKTALNDFHQAFQLTWRLYHSLEQSHHNKSCLGINRYLEDVISFASETRDSRSIAVQVPSKTPYYIWSLFHLCDILRGNIYRKIENITEADRHYRHACSRFELISRQVEKDGEYSDSRIRSISDPRFIKWFITLTTIKALYERSKGQFDLGQFLESVRSQLTCIEYITLRKLLEEESAKEKDIIKRNKIKEENETGVSNLQKRIRRIEYFLDAERALPVYRKGYFTGLFGVDSESDLLPASVPFTPNSDLAKLIPADMAYLTSEILVRMGFAIYTMCDKSGLSDGGTSTKHTSYREGLTQYFIFHEKWNQLHKDTADEIKPSSLGTYCRTLFEELATPSEEEKDVFKRNIERHFAMVLRDSIKATEKGEDAKTKEKEAKEAKEKESLYKDIDFYNSIFLSTTQNIGNLATIPRRNQRVLMRRGYRFRRTLGDVSKDSVIEGLKACDENRRAHKVPTTQQKKDLMKFVVLRRWQSFNPKIPHLDNRRVLGGGYYLLWQGKGIVIDPGYDFIQNFYDEGFSLEDIDAVIITHSHPDHDDDFSSLTTLVKEWNEYHGKLGIREFDRTLDFFLNESTHKKFSSWLQSANVKYGRIIQLPSLCWNKDSESPAGPIRGSNVKIDLRAPSYEIEEKDLDVYNMVIEVIPAWHDDVIGKTSAVGLKFHLYDGSENKEGGNNEEKEDKAVGLIGYTADTGAYGLDIDSLESNEYTARKKNALRVDRMYEDCDLLIAHLGDIRIRELLSALHVSNMEIKKLPLYKLLEAYFAGMNGQEKEFPDKVNNFMQLAITLDLVPESVLKVKVESRGEEGEVSVRKWLRSYIEKGKDEYNFVGDWTPAKAFRTLIKGHEQSDLQKVNEKILAHLTAMDRAVLRFTENEAADRAYRLLEFITVCSCLPWKYPYHLGIFGIFELYKAMLNRLTNSDDESCKGKQDRVFIVGELPEELTSYRDKVAYWLNKFGDNTTPKNQNNPVRAFTGDIGLHLSLKLNKEKHCIDPKIRCTYCNYNNEIVCNHTDNNIVVKGKENYHDPSKIKETPLKRLNSAMIYLCTEYDHSPDRTECFLSRPEIRVV